ncbi:unnamed protein product [Paramecium pentaurelia]|uniref:Uncharacterized protein n=1 Tax=Paramecium pentaurelia TaxID=43138 RepID=A0A8S1WSU3_9CILI|nr:unnamed protein product [Paramecium pentaurelia]
MPINPLPPQITYHVPLIQTKSFIRQFSVLKINQQQWKQKIRQYLELSSESK